MMAITCIWLVLLSFPNSIGALKDPMIPEALFYPFGVDVGDSVFTAGGYSSHHFSMDVNFPYFNKSLGTYRPTFIYNGFMSFLQRTGSYSPETFPLPVRIIAPFWSEIDTGVNNGRVYYRDSKVEILLDRATQDVRRVFSSKGLNVFKAKWIFICTWHSVTYQGGSRTTPTNSFQMVLITDGNHSIAMFNYGRLTWTTGTLSGGDPATGLGGMAAQAGFNAGDNVTFFALPGSRQPSILKLAQTTNAGLKGRWMYRIDGTTIEAGSSCEVDIEECAVYQQFDVKTNSCLDVAPAFDCPTLEGPAVIDRRWVEFYCVIPTNETSDQAAFDVTFLFNGEPAPNAPSIVVRSKSPKATLHEKHLGRRLLGKSISCRVFSFWLNDVETVAERNKTLKSINSYWAGIEVSSYMLSVHEGDPKPAVLTLKSTIPITCRRREGVLEDSCDLTLKLTTSKDILIKSRNGSECIITLTEKDWKTDERKAYKLEERIEIFAKIDSFVTGPRWNTLTIDIDTLPDKVTADGESYKNMWSRHKLPEIGVYHHDKSHGVCRSTGDPHVTTFDRLYYTIYARGQFTYVQTTYGTPVEVQLRHRPCGRIVSCVCGVAARENDIILMADMCADSRLHYITYNNKQHKDAVIKKDDNGRVFEINLPSKIKVVGYVNFWGLGVEIYVTSSEYKRTEGLCGSLDKNPDNDLKIKRGNKPANSTSDIVESWRVPLGKSLFDGIATTLPVGSESARDGKSSFCSCLEGVSSCQSWMSDNSFPNGPNVGANSNVIPKTVGKFSANKIGRRRRALSEDSLTDDIDWEYDSSAFNYSSPEPPRRPENASGITEEEARRHCRRVLWDDSAVRASCESIASMDDVDGIIDKCIFDVQMTGDTSWADDKIPEIQNLCIFEAITANITESNSTIESITSFIREITAVVCLPHDCSGHGNCSNGTCICDKGYVGSDCALSKDAVPNILRTLGPPACDLDRYPCQKVEMVTNDVKSLPELACKVEVTKSDNSKILFKTLALVETMDTASCKLPTDELHGSLLHPVRTNFIPTTSLPKLEQVDFFSLPMGNSVLHYSISISNNGIRFSNARPLTVYNSKCYTCSGGSCSRKGDSCLINGYCFANGERNPFNPASERCEPLVSTTLWTKAPDMTVAVVAVITVVAVILTVIVVYFIIRRK